MSEEEKKAIEVFKEILFERDRINEIEDEEEREIEKSAYFEEMPFDEIEIVLNLINKKQKEIEEKTTILLAGAEKVKQLEKEIEDLKDKQDYARLEKEQLLEDVQNNYIGKDKIREYKKAYVQKREKEIKELGMSMLGSAIDVLEKLLGE